MLIHLLSRHLQLCAFWLQVFFSCLHHIYYQGEIKQFLPFLQRQIEIINPKIIYLLGTTAAKAILSTPLSLDTLREKWHNYKSINMDTSVKVLVSYHPSTVLQSPKLKKEAWDDLQMLQKELNEN